VSVKTMQLRSAEVAGASVVATGIEPGWMERLLRIASHHIPLATIYQAQAEAPNFRALLCAGNFTGGGWFVVVSNQEPRKERCTSNCRVRATGFQVVKTATGSPCTRYLVIKTHPYCSRRIINTTDSLFCSTSYRCAIDGNFER
jgi:hypothetical protein